MRIKQRAVGFKTIHPNDRVYFAVLKPRNTKPKPILVLNDVDNIKPIENVVLNPDLKGTHPVFVSKKWSLGKAVDSICDVVSIPNRNNEWGDSKLRIFRDLDKYCVSPHKMDIEISELIKQEILIEGDRIIIEYISSQELSAIDENCQLFLNK